jgi:peptidoglycan/xylan/chitin deacetylase (PgdA/CDA1 family)
LYDVNNQVQLGYFKSTKAQLSIRIDEVFESSYNNYFPYFTAKGIKGVFSLNTYTVETGVYITWAHAIEIYNAGHEIENHTNSTGLGYNTPAEVRADLAAADAAFTAHGIALTHIYCLHSTGYLNVYARQYVLKNHRAWWACRNPRAEEGTQREIVEKDLLDSMSVYTGALVYDVTTPGGLAACKAQLDIAIAGKRIACTFVHSWEPAEQDGINELIDYFVAAGGEIVTHKQALDNCRYLPLQYETLISGLTEYRRGINYTTDQYILDYSADGGATWETLVSLDPTEDSIIIDALNLYRHRIVGIQYRIDQTLTATGYAGTENIDWENIYST